jgi:hypothetical protein
MEVRVKTLLWVPDVSAELSAAYILALLSATAGYCTAMYCVIMASEEPPGSPRFEIAERAWARAVLSFRTAIRRHS